MAVSVQQAGLNALAAYLKTVSGFSDVQIDSFWPESDVSLPPKAITVITAGPRQTDADATQLMKALSSRDTDPPSANRIFLWELAAFRQPVQLDVWATNAVDRDDMLAQLDSALRAGLGTTLAAANTDPFRDGVLLALGDNYTGKADFTFDSPNLIDGALGAGRDEFRATVRGEMAVNLAVEATSPALARVKLKLTLQNGPVAPSQTDTWTITATDLTRSVP